jgi:hypothetical protein
MFWNASTTIPHMLTRSLSEVLRLLKNGRHFILGFFVWCLFFLRGGTFNPIKAASITLTLIAA